jgi:hypothetical protein
MLDALGILFEADYTTEGPADRTRERSHKKEAVRVEKDGLMPDAEQPSVSAPEAWRARPREEARGKIAAPVPAAIRTTTARRMR